MSELIKKTFDQVCANYDDEALAFFPRSAEALVRRLSLSDAENVLDVATGTGNLALLIAGALPRGHVTAVDFSPGMLECARQKAELNQVTNVDFIETDMQELDFTQASFDIAACGFGLFFVEDMRGQLRKIASMVKPGGTVAISTFEENHFFNPLVDMMFERLEAYGVEKPPQTWKQVGTEKGCQEIFREAGMAETRVDYENVGYHLDGPEGWWNVIRYGGMRRVIEKLKPDDLESFRVEHLKDVEALRTDQGIWLDVGVLFTLGFKPVS